MRGIFGLFPEEAVDKARIVFNDEKDIGYEKELVFEFGRQETGNFVKEYVELRKKELEEPVKREILQSKSLLINWIKNKSDG